MNIPISYLQTDRRWSGLDYSAPGEKTTIGASGCGPTSMAMIIASLVDRRVTPKETCAWALQRGYKASGQGTYYSYFVPAGEHYNIKVARLNTVDLRQMTSGAAKDIHRKAAGALKNGSWAIACMGKGLWTSSGHYILAYGLSQDKVLVRDPDSTAEARVRGDMAAFQSQVKFYWIVDVKKKEEEEPAVRYAKLEEIPNEFGFRDIVAKLMDAKIIEGTGGDERIDLSYDQLRDIVITYRGGGFDRKLICAGLEPAVKV